MSNIKNKMKEIYFEKIRNNFYVILNDHFIKKTKPLFSQIQHKALIVTVV